MHSQKSDHTIHLICNIDENYTRYCCVMLLSAFDNTPEAPFHVHLIADELSENARQSLENITNRFGHKISFYFDNQALLADCPVPQNSHISLATYYRCFLDTILPEDIDKAIYMDCDIIIRDSLKDFWDTDIQGYAIGGVEDMWADKDLYYDRLGFDPRFSYCNAGVLLINLQYWREFKTTEKVGEYLKNATTEFFYYDQDILNKIFYDKKKLLPFRWNAQDEYFRTKRTARREVWPELEECIKNPAVIHFTGKKKPWHVMNNHPYKSLYYYYLDQTEWKGERSRPTLYEYNKIISNWIPIALGIKKRVYRKIPKQYIIPASQLKK